MPKSFGGKKPYLADFEIADDISPDPFSEEPLPHSFQHTHRQTKVKKNNKVKSEKSEEINRYNENT